MMMMKNPVILVACTVLFFSAIVLASQTSYSPDECCFQFISRPLPKRNVVTYKNTDKRCPMAGVLFTMKTGAEICADPTVAWVKNIIEAKEKIRAKKLNAGLKV